MRLGLLIFIFMACFAAYSQISYVPDEKSDKYTLRKPILRLNNPLRAVYQEYDMSPVKEKELDQSVEWTLNWEDVKNCKRIGRITTPGRVLTSYVEDRTDCEISIRTLMDLTQRRGGDTLYISVMPQSCQLGRFLSYAMKCSANEQP